MSAAPAITLPTAINHLLKVVTHVHQAPTDVAKKYAPKVLVGDPGIGKTEMAVQKFMALADTLSTEERPVECHIETPLVSGFTETDVRGFPFPQKIERNGETRLIAVWAESSIIAPLWGAHDRIVASGKTPLIILFFDELFQTPDGVMKPLGQIFNEHRIGPHSLPPRTIMFAASNLMSNRTGVMRQMPHVTNRLSIVRVSLCLPTWKAWAVREGVHYTYTSFVQRNPQLVTAGPPAEPNEPFATIRSLTNASRFHSLFPDPHQPQMLDCSLDMAHELAGYMGTAVATQFVSHARTGAELPSLDDIMADPDRCRIPSEAAPQAQLMFYLPSLCPPLEELTCLTDIPGFSNVAEDFLQPAQTSQQRQIYAGVGSIDANEVFDRLLRYTERLDRSMKGKTYSGFMQKTSSKLLRHPRMKQYLKENSKLLAASF